VSKLGQAPNAGSVLLVLLLANLVNFYDRAIPMILLEPIRKEWNLSDFQLGMIPASFTVVFALACIPLGRLADTTSRKSVMGLGLIAWSAFTALGAASWSFGSFLVTRVAVGIGEASYAPSAIAMIGDLFAPNRRARALGVFSLGLPLGLILAFFTVGALARYFESWRAPFVIAMIPGLLIAALVLRISEPVRGAAEMVRVPQVRIAHPVRRVLGIRTMLWLVPAGAASNFAAYATNSFLVPLFQRYFGLSLEQAAISTGVIVGVTGLVGLTLGGWIADRLHRGSPVNRLLFGGICLALASFGIWLALGLQPSQSGLFVTIFAFAWLLQYAYYVSVFPAIQDVVDPRLRGTAMAIYIAAINVLGGAFGPAVVGYLSDHYAQTAALAAGVSGMTEAFKAAGLHHAMMAVPVALMISAVAVLMAARHFSADAQTMLARMSEQDPSTT
jgi:MFS family permease